jgi:hypothetical protein
MQKQKPVTQQDLLNMFFTFLDSLEPDKERILQEIADEKQQAIFNEIENLNSEATK